jgi:hypothetical protein
METSVNSAVLAHRRRQAERGVVRLELQASAADDVGQLRALTAALRAGGPNAERLRSIVRNALEPPPAESLLELLACDLDDALVDEVLARPSDVGRNVDL